MEYLVHVPLSIIPDDLKIASIKIPDDAPTEEISVLELDPAWRATPPPDQLSTIGRHWATHRASLVLRVPSVVVENEFNLLLNPLHPDIRRVSIIETVDFMFDHRLLRS